MYIERLIWYAKTGINFYFYHLHDLLQDLIGRLDPHQSALIFGEDLSRCKSLLQEFVMHSMGGTPKYKAEPRGEAHNLQWTAEVTLPDGNVFNTRPTCYNNKKMAECAAARLALSWLLGITTSSPPPEFVQEEESAESQKARTGIRYSSISRYSFETFKMNRI